MTTNLIALLLSASFMATAIVHAASATTQTAPKAMTLRTQENICLAPLTQGVNFKAFVEVITDDQQKRTVAVSSEARLKRIFASLDLDANGVLNAAEVLGRKAATTSTAGRVATPRPAMDAQPSAIVIGTKGVAPKTGTRRDVESQELTWVGELNLRVGKELCNIPVDGF
jgi:hypothetical protein